MGPTRGVLSRRQGNGRWRGGNSGIRGVVKVHHLCIKKKKPAIGGEKDASQESSSYFLAMTHLQYCLRYVDFLKILSPIAIIGNSKKAISN